MSELDELLELDALLELDVLRDAMYSGSACASQPSTAGSFRKVSKSACWSRSRWMGDRDSGLDDARLSRADSGAMGSRSKLTGVDAISETGIVPELKLELELELEDDAVLN